MDSLNNPRIKHVLAIGSGKGGVGKSTLSINIATAAAVMDLKVGLLDADIYGPSVPIMMGLRNISPQMTQDEIYIPVKKFGVETMSIGFLVEETHSMVWRGPMFHAALQKMILQTKWPDLDLLIVDLPPGTGDATISLTQILPVTAGLIVCTPQRVAILDALKAIGTFSTLKIPTLGIVENMSFFQAAGEAKKHALFGEGHLEDLAKRTKIPLLEKLPIDPRLQQSCDEGRPFSFFHSSSDLGNKFMDITQTIYTQLEAICKAKQKSLAK